LRSTDPTGLTDAAPGMPANIADMIQKRADDEVKAGEPGVYASMATAAGVDGYGEGTPNPNNEPYTVTPRLTTRDKVVLVLFGALGLYFDHLLNDRNDLGMMEKKASPNQMQQQVARGQAPKSVDRVDRGDPNQFEKDHVHFIDGSAINDDGTWKHGGRELSNGEKIWLSENGWYNK
jgi:hypothetical protein